MQAEDVQTPEESTAENEKFWFSLLLTLTLPWALVFVPQWLAWHFLYEFFGFFAAMAGVLGATLWLLAAAVLRSRRTFVVALVIGLLSLAALSGLPTWIKARVTLLFRQGTYRSMIDEVIANPNTWEEAHPELFVDNPETSPRVAFNLRNGMIDDFGAIIYDPSGVVALESSRENKEVFEGVLGSAHHLWGPWYYGILYPD